MSIHSDSGRARVKLLAVLAVVSTLLAALGLSLGSIARADTSGSPDTNTKAAFAPTAANLNPGATLNGAVEGTPVNIHVDGSSGKFFGVNAARLCKQGLTVTTASQLSPSQFGNCIPQPFVAGSDDDFKSVLSDSSHTFVDFQFRVGSGTQTFSYSGGSSTITCDVTTPCSIWLQESVDTSIASSGNIYKHYDVTYAGAPDAPTVASTPGNQQLAVAITAPANNGNTSSPLKYTVTVSGGDCPGPAGCGAQPESTSTNYTIGNLTNFQQYTVTATAKSSAANGTTTFTGSAGSAGPNASTAPVPPPPTNVQGTPADGQVSVTWTAPAGPTPTSYDVLASPAPAAPPNPRNAGNSATSYTFTGLTNGVVYSFQVRGVYSGMPGQYSAASGPITPQGKFVTQTITVTRPQGDLVLTQVCGAHGATTTGTAPTLGSAPGGAADPLLGQYPYPVDANGVPNPNYPTNCGIDLGTAHLLTSSTGAGQFFEATGLLNQITVADTRDADPGFTVNGQMGSFTNGGPSAHDSFSGSQLGWTPAKTSDSPGFTASDGTTYDQSVAAGPVVAPNTANASGLSSGAQLGQAGAGQGLGIAVLDANLKLWIPIYANHGVYSGTLTISAV